MKKPLYIQFSDTLRNLILNNEYKYGCVFPPERELETQYGIDRKTIRKSLNILVEEGLLIRIQGKGTFVNSPDISYSMKNISGFSRLLKQQGIHSTTKVISVSEEQAGYRLSKIMDIERYELVWKMVRLRMAEEQPVALEITYIGQDLIPDFRELDFEVYSLYETLSSNGHIPSCIEEKISAVELGAAEAKYLDQIEGDTVFLVTDITKDQTGRVIEYNRAYTNSNRIRLSTRLTT